jgi:glucosyl-3-phosphoglycerate phosphatase
MTSRTWYLVRHGETEWNAARRMQGQLDSPLTPQGREHAKTTARLLARLGVDVVHASPLGRVRETLAFLAGEVALEPAFDDRLKEWSSGDWSGEYYADLRQKWPREFAAWEADRYNYRPPGAENFQDLAGRARAFLDDAAGTTGQRIAVVAHGFLNRALVAGLLSLAPAETLRIRQRNDVIIRVAVRGTTAVADHFIGGAGPFAGLPGDSA